MSGPIRILACDGGSGGPTYTRVLRVMEERNPGFLAKTDVFAGNSFGTFVSLYLAAKLPKNATSAQSVKALEECLATSTEFIESLLPTTEGYARLAMGRESMASDLGELEVFKKTFGDMTLKDLNHKVVIISGRGEAPFTPVVMCNFGPNASMDLKVVDAAMRSVAFPIWMPLWQGDTDGFLYTNTPAMVAVTEVVAGWRGRRDPTLLDDIVVLSMGQDGGSSELGTDVSELLGGDPMKQAAAEAAEAIGHRLNDLFGKPDLSPVAFFEELASNLAKHAKSLASKQQELEDLLEKTGLTLHQSPPPEDPKTPTHSWGWIRWLGEVTQPFLLVQVMMNNQGLGVTTQCERLLGEDRALRVAPSGIATTNDILILLFLAQNDLVQWDAELTAAAWGWSPSSLAFGFHPNVDDTSTWLQKRWLKGGQATPNPTYASSGSASAPRKTGKRARLRSILERLGSAVRSALRD